MTQDQLNILRGAQIKTWQVRTLPFHGIDQQISNMLSEISELRTLIAAMEKQEPVDKGPWCAGMNRGDNRIFIESEDFTHDVRLYVDGDFGTKDEKYLYACGIAKMLNTHAQPVEQPPLPQHRYTELAHRIASRYRHDSHPSYVEYVFQPHTLDDFVRAIEQEIKKK